MHKSNTARKSYPVSEKFHAPTMITPLGWQNGGFGIIHVDTFIVRY